MDNQWMKYYPYWNDGTGLLSLYRVNQWVELLWKLGKYVEGLKLLDLDVVLSRLYSMQRDNQLQFIVRLRDAHARNELKKGVYPIDGWRSGRKQAKRASSDRDLSLIAAFGAYLELRNLTMASDVQDMQRVLFTELGGLPQEEIDGWVCNVHTPDLHKLKHRLVLPKSDAKDVVYRRLFSWLCQVINQQK